MRRFPVLEITDRRVPWAYFVGLLLELASTAVGMALVFWLAAALAALVRGAA